MIYLETRDRDFSRKLKRILEKRAQVSQEVRERVEEIFQEVKKRGIKAVLKYAREYDGFVGKEADLQVKPGEFLQAEKSLSEKEKSAIKKALKRIERFHKNQLPKGFQLREKGGYLRERWIALERVGIYIPAGKYPLASTVLMTVIPARLAGVREILLTTPAPGGKIHPAILYSAKLAEADVVYKLGGAQAIFALSLGVKPVKKVDKIVGPGGIYVSTAKIYAYSLGLVGIDTLAGPSEVVILADGSAPLEFALSDLLAQLEHGKDSWGFLLSNKQSFLLEAKARLKKEKGNLVLIFCRSKKEMIELANQIAPEHLELQVRKPESWADKITTAGAVFLGAWSPVAIGDYLAGTNHCLPTGGRARFDSPLGVWDFLRRQSEVYFSRELSSSLGRLAIDFARIEGLEKHARSLEIRKDKKKFQD